MSKQDKGHRKIRKWKSGPNFSGQHLMHNKRIINEVIRLSGMDKKKTVIDLGAGKGAFTFHLAEKAARVLAVENDPALIKILEKRAENYSNIIVIDKDIRQWNAPNTPFYVVSSIPYSITTTIMDQLLSKPTNGLQGGIIIMEEGAAKRFSANPIIDPRILGWRMWFDIRIVKYISRVNFSPPPKVDSAAIRINRREYSKISAQHYTEFMGLAEYGLKQPKLSVYEVLRGIFTNPQIKLLLKNLGVQRDISICMLNIDQWEIVFQTMLQYVESYRWPKARKHRY